MHVHSQTIIFILNIAYIAIIAVVQRDKNKPVFGLAHFYIKFIAG